MSHHEHAPARPIAIIGGTGLGQALFGREGGERIEVSTPFGAPSSPLIRAKWDGAEVLFLNRHGDGHRLSPSHVPYRANIFALKQLGASVVLASGATGSLRDEIAPGHLVIADQVFDRTHRRASTFFDEGIAVHVEFGEPFCERIRGALLETARGLSFRVHPAGTYVCMEGPQFSTRAESHMHRAWGGDLIGMTVMPEAKLAREAEMCYALIALPTDYDCWRPHDPAAGKAALLREILDNLNQATDAALQLIKAAIPRLAALAAEPCSCRSALDLAVWSDKSRVDRGLVEKLRPLIGRLFADNQS